MVMGNLPQYKNKNKNINNYSLDDLYDKTVRNRILFINDIYDNLGDNYNIATFNFNITNLYKVFELFQMTEVKSVYRYSDYNVNKKGDKTFYYNFLTLYKGVFNGHEFYTIIYINNNSNSYDLKNNFSLEKAKQYGDEKTIAYVDFHFASNICNEDFMIKFNTYREENLDDLFYVESNLRNNNIYFIVKAPTGFALNSYTIKNPTVHIDNAYGKGFVDKYTKIVNDIEDNDKGLYIFHGVPGCGKTNLIRKLCYDLNKKVIYLPTELASAIDDPSFIDFLKREAENSVIVIEDADNVIRSRENGGTIVKTLLNLTDGILGDCLKLNIILTFNMDKTNIDQALLRKGRLSYIHEFGKLNKEESLEMAKILDIDESLIVEDSYALCDIYNINDIVDVKPTEPKMKKIGF